jgi:predicted dehydrogenase
VIGVGVIGYGYWGPNLVRNFVQASGSTVVAVSDLRPERLAQMKSRYPGVRATDDHKALLAEPAIDAVVIATPVATHYRLALEALEAGKHVLVEKPLTATSEQARRLIDEAARRRLVLLVDHTFVYTGAVRKIRELVDAKALGDVYYYDSVRVNLGVFQHDVNVLWDLAVHDLAILDHVLAARPVAVSATGISHVPGQPENVAYVTLFFGDRLIAHVHANWLAPVKMRKTLIGGSDKMIVYDDIEPSEKVKVYDKGVTVSPSVETVYELLVGYRSGDMWAPHLEQTEALETEAVHFLDCIEHARPPITGGQAGLRVVRLLEAADQSLRGRGRLVELPDLDRA